MHVHGGGPAVVRNDLEDIAEAGITFSDASQYFFPKGPQHHRYTQKLVSIYTNVELINSLSRCYTVLYKTPFF